ncbi:hypothetical protein GK047_09250 [Paenibacillus sp. SYP-B3998]|uniref:RsfA family transcriptional regulator n=1 Tax=Paenibacillus sp. SYP-B3998 TaxID=2678564 RepID=A0A6G3ZVE8_9BACL|nr:hypothetical protein [Paenibacillus sp. SYP-B3998]NEW06196.1 hypothetical protein [Paenibacillus sp. SYP-B3998]
MTRATRNDSWTIENDAALAKTVLKHIGSGSTQLAAFEEAADLLKRTSAACGFRWNAEVRKHYASEIKKSKTQRLNNLAERQGKRSIGGAARSGQSEIYVTVSQMDLNGTHQNELVKDDLDQIVHLAQNQKVKLDNIVKQNQRLHERLLEKDSEIEHLKRQLNEAKSQPSELTVNEDYKTLMDILKRARKIGAMDEVEKQKPAFKMDASGNIEMLG